MMYAHIQFAHFKVPFDNLLFYLRSLKNPLYHIRGLNKWLIASKLVILVTFYAFRRLIKYDSDTSDAIIF